MMCLRNELNGCLSQVLDLLGIYNQLPPSLLIVESKRRDCTGQVSDQFSFATSQAYARGKQAWIMVGHGTSRITGTPATGNFAAVAVVRIMKSGVRSRT